jgi:hypothetical protein
LFPCNLQCAPGRIAFAPRCRYGRSAAAPYIAPRASLPVRAQRCCALHRASRLAAGTGAALLRPTSRLAPRCRYGRSAAAPYIAPRASLPVRAQRCCALHRASRLAAGTGAALLRPTSRLAPRCRYGRRAAAPLHRPSRLAAGTGAALLRPYIAPRASLPVRAPRCCALHRASRLAAGTGAALLRPTSRLAPRCRYGRSAAAPYIAPRASLPVRAQRRCAPTSRLAPRLPVRAQRCCAPTSLLAAGTGAALLRPYIAPRASLPVRAQPSRLAAGTGAALLRPYIAPRASSPRASSLAPHSLAPHSLAPLVPHPCIPSNTPPWNTINAASHAMANCPSRLTSIQRVPNSCRFAASAATHGV